MTIISTLLMGIGIPVVGQWISGGLGSFKKEATLRNVALSSVAGIAITAIASQMMLQPAPAVRVRRMNGGCCPERANRLRSQPSSIPSPGAGYAELYGPPNYSKSMLVSSYPNGSKDLINID